MNSIQLTDSGVVATCVQCGQRNRLKFEKLGESFRCGKCQAAVAPPGQPLDVTEDAAFFAVLAGSSIPILVDFWAPWCGPCKMVAPEVAKLAAEAAGKILVLKVNTEESQTLAQRYHITGIPTFIVFNRGQAVAQQSGAMSAAQLKRLATAVG